MIAACNITIYNIIHKQAVGLLFTGFNTTTIMNPIQFLPDVLQVQLVTACMNYNLLHISSLIPGRSP